MGYIIAMCANPWVSVYAVKQKGPLVCEVVTKRIVTIRIALLITFMSVADPGFAEKVWTYVKTKESVGLEGVPHGYANVSIIYLSLTCFM